MEVVDKKDAAKLLPIMQTVVQRGLIIHSDEWRFYTILYKDLASHTGQ